MAVRISQEPDDRLTQMIKDPATYFEKARDRIRVEVDEEIERERQGGQR